MKHKLIGATLMACAAMAGCTSAYSGAPAPAADPAPQAEATPAPTPAPAPAPTPASAPSTELASGPGMEEVQAACSGCHVITMVTGKHYSEDRWVEVVDQMISHGAYVPDDKFDVIVDYLIAHYGES